VTDMSGMFRSADAFNQDIGGWDSSSVMDMRWMFYYASAFDQDIGGWDVTALTDAESMFENTKLSTPNYDALLIGWDTQTLQAHVNFSGGDSNYCVGEAARSNMIAADSWVITDGGKDCTEPEIEVIGSGVTITNGDITPSIADDTDFGSIILGGSSSKI